MRDNVKPALELVVTILNINYAIGIDILDKNKDLKEYAIFVEKVREHQKNGLDFVSAVRQAVKDCKAENILTEFFQKYESEVDTMFSLVYDIELAKKYAAEEAREDAWEQGIEQGIMIVAGNLLQKGTDIFEVKEITGLPVAVLEKLKNNLVTN